MGILHCATLSSFNLSALFLHTHISTRTDKHTWHANDTHTHTHSVQTVSAQVAVSAARTADAVLIIGCDR